MADHFWVHGDTDEDIYVEALALGADQFTLSARRRAKKFSDSKRALECKCYCVCEGVLCMYCDEYVMRMLLMMVFIIVMISL